MLNIEEVKLPSGQKLTDDYISEFFQISSAYDYHFLQEAAWDKRAEWLDKSAALRADRKLLAQALGDYNEQMGNSREALAQAARLALPDTLAIVGGQQAGLFTGPLYVIHKAVTIIKLAEQMQSRLHRPVVPVFWIAGEDHDLAEVNHLHVLTKTLQVEKLTIGDPSAAGERIPVSKRQFARHEWEKAIAQLEEALIDTEYKPELIGKLAAISSQARTLTDSFARIMAWLFGKYGLILLDSDDSCVRKLEGPMFQQLAVRHRELNDAYLRDTDKVVAMGYAAQAAVGENNVNLFLRHREERTLLFAKMNRIEDKKGQLSLSEDELWQIAESEPERLSNNVLTRPLMQDYLFPVLAAVLGPGEIAYWGQTASAFHVLGMRQPIIVPRLSFTLVEGTVAKQMHKYALSFTDVLFHFAEKKQEWLSTQDEFRLEEKFAFVKAEFARMYRPLLAQIGAVNSGVGSLGEANLQKIMEQIEFLRLKAAGALASQHEAAVRQLDKIKLTIHPMEKMQERMYNCFAYLNRYGNGWIDELIQQPIPINGRHKIVYL